MLSLSFVEKELFLKNQEKVDYSSHIYTIHSYLTEDKINEHLNVILGGPQSLDFEALV